MVLKISFSLLYFILAASCMHPNLPDKGSSSAATVGSSTADPNDAAIEYGFTLCRQMASTRYRDHLVDRVTRYQFCKYMGGEDIDYTIFDTYFENCSRVEDEGADWIGLDEFNQLFRNHSIQRGIPLEEFVKHRNNVALGLLQADKAYWETIRKNKD
ncbi:uncharacterized protein LOC126838633 [Adelges cooleyi]|uniref:uncharacterized protein LOC126838633 n=1 Tax=Adelges cooleyi TaxID=133065 RepID=UPI0021801D90|nr:uncharacterized protein LOC126838633 [Adelges cooleyi]